MPFRSPKMYSFIFGFQRRTWWPKCTPASNNSFIVTVTKQLSPLCQLVYVLAATGVPTFGTTNQNRDNGILRSQISDLKFQTYRFENWNRLRAPFWPYFLRSLIRGSRVTRPACFKAGRRSPLYSIKARVIP